MLTGSASGAVAHAEDAFEGAALRGIVVEGACRQDGTPSPENPVPIEVVENPVVKVVGRNLLDIAALAKESPEYYKADGDTLTILKTDNRAWTSFAAAQELKAGTYILSGDFADLRDVDGNSLSYTNGITGVPFTLPVDTKVKIKIGYGRTLESYPHTSKAMIERSSSASDYAPYSPQSRAFALPAEHPYLAKLPDGTADIIEVDEKGNVELVARVGKVVPTKDSTLFYSDPVGAPYVNLRFETARRDASLMCSSHTVSKWTTESGFVYCPSTSGLIVRDSRFTSLDVALKLLEDTVIYVEIQEKRYPLAPIDMPKAQDSIVNAWTDAEVTPSTSIRYIRDVNIVVANIESAIASIS